MNKRVRSTIFWIFTLIFFISAPLIVLYTAGYRYNPKNGSFVRTGAVSLTSSPRNASILIDGESIGKTTPYVIKRILPGSYEVTLDREGYHPWTGEIEVESGATTSVQQAYLLLDEIPQELFSVPIESLAASPDSETLIYTILDGGWTELWHYDITSNVTTLIDRIQTSAPFTISWSAEGNYFNIFSEEDSTLRLYARNGLILPINDSIPENIERIFWDATSSKLYAAGTESLYELNPAENTILSSPNSDAISVLLDASVLTFFDNGTHIELRQSDGNNQELIALLPRGQYIIEERDGSYLLLRDGRSQIFVIDIAAEQPILLETQATAFAWSDQRNELAFSDGYEITIYTPESHTFEFVTRQSDPLVALAWHPSGRILLSASKTKLTAIHRHLQSEKRQMFTLYEWTEIDEFWVSSDGKFAYVFGNQIGIEGLFQLPLRK